MACVNIRRSSVRTSPIALITIAMVAFALSALSLGCEGITVPEKIAMAPQQDQGIGGSSCSGGPEEDCEPHVVEMCDFVNNRPSLKLGKLVDYDFVDEDVPCEDWEYRRRHAIATFQVLDPIAGEDMGTHLELINFSGHGGWEPGSYYLFYPWERDGKQFLGYTREVVVDDDAAGIAEDSTSGIAGSDTVYDVPTNYAEFASEAVEHWYNFDEKCPDHDLHIYGEVLSDEEFEASLYDKDCGGDEAVNQTHNDEEDPWSENEDDDL